LAAMKIKIKDDPAINQIREIRHQISAEFGHDPRRVLAYYSQFEGNLLRERAASAIEKRTAEE
jgi:hypothetical protein